ncbi:MAG: anthranilate synthase component I family protein, partial [Candidatus Obscuribacterales bacterium]|nr:anthranilate synthase component I family protein [Candidatus Obscuribacterales bacterium]
CRDLQLSLTALAGTRPRGKDDIEEEALEKELRSSEKELAEHYMLVDLGRNDLGRVAAIGSVAPGEIARVIRYGQVMHLSTEISARLKSGLTCFDAVRSCFPAGTVSGAPKIRAMELLAELEPEKRGIYSGLVGYFDIKGNTDSAIAIRSAIVKKGVAHVSAGAGIVQDSDPLSEYEETRSKAMSVLKAISIADEM